MCLIYSLWTASYHTLEEHSKNGLFLVKIYTGSTTTPTDAKGKIHIDFGGKKIKPIMSQYTF